MSRQIFSFCLFMTFLWLFGGGVSVIGIVIPECENHFPDLKNAPGVIRLLLRRSSSVRGRMKIISPYQ